MGKSKVNKVTFRFSSNFRFTDRSAGKSFLINISR